MSIAKEIAKQLRAQAKVLELQADALDADLNVPLPFGSAPELLMLRLPEVATRLGLSYSKVFKMVTMQQLPGRKVGRVWRVPFASLQTWVDKDECT